LKPGHAYTRDTVLGMRVLSATELGRARECLIDCGALRSFQVVTERRHKLFCIALTGNALPQPKRRVAPKNRPELCFEALLSAWRMKQPLATSLSSSFIQDRFYQEETQELALLLKEQPGPSRRKCMGDQH